MALTTLLLAIYYFLQDNPQRRAARALGMTPSLVSKIFRRLQDVCSVDLQNRPFIPFGGPGTVAKCDESKFNHRPKVTPRYFLTATSGAYFSKSKKLSRKSVQAFMLFVHHPAHGIRSGSPYFKILRKGPPI